MTTDPIADFLTRLRNAVAAKHASLELPASRMRADLARILQEEGYVRDFQVVREGPQGTIRISLKYGPAGEPVLRGLRRVSRPGRRVYMGKDALPKVLGGLGICVVSTPRGVLTDRQAREMGVGGEVLCTIW